MSLDILCNVLDIAVKRRHVMNHFLSSTDSDSIFHQDCFILRQFRMLVLLKRKMLLNSNQSFNKNVCQEPSLAHHDKWRPYLVDL